MTINTITWTFVTLTTLTATAALAQDHQASIGGQMKHIFVTFDGTALAAAVGDPTVPTPQLRDLRPMGQDYSGDKSVLNGTAHNGQYGWMAGGFIERPADTAIFVRLLSQTPGLRTYAPDDLTPLFGTDGASDTWQWTGGMIHNWYAVDFDQITAPDMPVFASYELYIGHAAGPEYAQAVDGYDSATVQLDFTAIPEPAAALGWVGLSLLISQRRRTVRV